MRRVALCLLLFAWLAGSAAGQRQMERLDRGTVALRRPEGGAFVSWRLLGNEPDDVRVQRLPPDRRATPSNA